jgi:tRNA nucleotidyltransferase (CCA-adding enzyme)
VTREGRLVGAITRTDLLQVLQDEIAKSLSSKMEFHEIYPKRKNVRRLMEERLDEASFTRIVEIGRLAGRMGYHAYLVGGFVRDLLLRIDNYDVDIVIEGDGIKFAEEMAREFGVKVRPHREFGTAKLIYPDGFKLDIATARLEYYKAPAALPVVEHGSLKLDLYRRDFAINTLAISLTKNTFGELIDFFGGQRDLKDKTIRVLHSLSFVEDPTRVFRAIRFEHRFGFHIGKHTLNLIRNAVKMNFLAKIRGRRIWTELSLILLEDEPEKILKRLHELDLLRFISDKLIFNKEKEGLFHQMQSVLNWYDLLYRGKPCDRLQFTILGLIDHMKDEEIPEFCRITEMSEKLRNRTVENITRARSVIVNLLTHSYSMKRSGIYRLFEELSPEALLFVMARTKSEEIKRHLSSYITFIDTLKPQVAGRDLKRMGVAEGPVFKRILSALKEAKIDLDLKTREEEIGFVRDFISREGVD